jgi:hypothetical protein
MTIATRSALAVVVLAAGVTLASAQTTQDHDTHHPPDQKAQAQQPTPGPRGMGRGPGQAGMPMAPGGPQGMMMGGDMSQMMGMMQMMRMMQDGPMPMGMGPGGIRPLQHVEGQLAFWKAELKITDAQAPQWNAFADAFRSSATQFRQAITQLPNTTGAVAAPDLIERRVGLLTAELEAMKPVLATAKPLYAALSDDQKKTADELMAEHFMAMRGRGL